MEKKAHYQYYIYLTTNVSSQGHNPRTLYLKGQKYLECLSTDWYGTSVGRFGTFLDS